MGKSDPHLKARTKSSSSSAPWRITNGRSTGSRRASSWRRGLSVADFVGASAPSGTAGHVAEKSCLPGQTPFDPTGLAERIIADALPVRFQRNAQNDLAAGTTRRLMSQTEASPRSAAALTSPANVTFIEQDGSWPIVWERAKGVHVWDAEGKNTWIYRGLRRRRGRPREPSVVRAGQKQMANCCTRWATCIRTRSRRNWRAN